MKFIWDGNICFLKFLNKPMQRERVVLMFFSNSVVSPPRESTGASLKLGCLEFRGFIYLLKSRASSFPWARAHYHVFRAEIELGIDFSLIKYTACLNPEAPAAF